MKRAAEGREMGPQEKAALAGRREAEALAQEAASLRERAKSLTDALGDLRAGQERLTSREGTAAYAAGGSAQQILESREAALRLEAGALRTRTEALLAQNEATQRGLRRARDWYGPIWEHVLGFPGGDTVTGAVLRNVAAATGKALDAAERAHADLTEAREALERADL